MSTKMPAGEYYVGDLCYVLHEWSPVVNALFPVLNSSMVEGKHTLPNGTCIGVFSTLYGDGEYLDQLDNAYSVDAGVIGCVLTSAISLDDTEGGHVHVFPSPFTISSDGANLTFGHIKIATGSSDSGEEYQSEDE